MNLQTYLEKHDVHYRLSSHQPVYSAQELAAVEHISGRHVIKPVIVKADGQFMMCALPANCRIDLAELQLQLLAEHVEIVPEDTVALVCHECEPGAEPPIGRMFDMPTVMDSALRDGDLVTFQAGTHDRAVTMTVAEYRRVACPELAYFGRSAVV